MRPVLEKPVSRNGLQAVAGFSILAYSYLRLTSASVINEGFRHASTFNLFANHPGVEMVGLAISDMDARTMSPPGHGPRRNTALHFPR
jgi:hypothetical protein